MILTGEFKVFIVLQSELFCIQYRALITDIQQGAGTIKRPDRRTEEQNFLIACCGPPFVTDQCIEFMRRRPTNNGSESNPKMCMDEFRHYLTF